MLAEHFFLYARIFFIAGSVILAGALTRLVCGSNEHVAVRISQIFIGLIAIAGVTALELWPVSRIEEKTFVTVEFKNSELFKKNSRRRRIREEFTKLRNYLVEIGFDVPRERPVILGTVRSSAPIQSGLSPGGPFEWQIRIPERDIDNPLMLRQVYSYAVFRHLLEAKDQSVAHLMNVDQAASVFSNYFAFSSCGKQQCSADNKWCNALWDIRESFGKEFADKTMFYSLQNWVPQQPTERSFDAYFMLRFNYGTFVSVNEESQNERIRQIFRNRGLLE
jgi:hypothetical protein